MYDTRNRCVRDTGAPAKWYWSQICHIREISVNLVDMFNFVFSPLTLTLNPSKENSCMTLVLKMENKLPSYFEIHLEVVLWTG